MYVGRVLCATVALLLFVLAMEAAPALADFKDLHGALLQRSDVPASFKHSKVSIVPRFVQYLHVDYVSKGSRPITLNSVCAAPPSAGRDGEIQTAAQTFFGSQNANFQLCGYLFKGDAGAQKAYGAFGAFARQALVVGFAKSLPSPHVGDTSLFFVGVSRGEANYLGLFRRANAVIELVYQGSRSYSPSSFLAAGERTSARLH